MQNLVIIIFLIDPKYHIINKLRLIIKLKYNNYINIINFKYL